MLISPHKNPVNFGFTIAFFRGSMKPPGSLPRREFLSVIGMASAVGAVPMVTPVADPGAPKRGQSEFLMAPGLTYLNTAALGPTPRAVLDRTLEAWYQLESNPVRMAYHDGAVHVATDRVREGLASFLRCTAEEILITRSTTDAMNCLVQGIRFRSGDRILTTNHEHEGGTICWEYAARRQGLELDMVQIPMAEHDPQRIVQFIADAIKPRTRVISVSHVFTSNGLRLPIAEIAALARSRGILSVVDGAQALGQFDVNLKALGCHAYAASGHKWLMGPKGTGLLYINREAAADIAPLQLEDGKRFVSNATGIGALPLVIGLGAAVDRLDVQGMPAVERCILDLRHHVFNGLAKISKLHLESPPKGPGATALVACRLPPDVQAQHLQSVLREKYGIMVKRVEPRFFNGIRLSAHIFNTEAEIDFALRAIRTELK